MVLLGDDGQSEARFGLFADNVSFSAKIGAQFASNVP
jgi:hypothetical protein